jgi:hypothetical protein
MNKKVSRFVINFLIKSQQPVVVAVPSFWTQITILTSTLSAGGDTIHVPEIRRACEHLHSIYGPEIATQIPVSN